MKYIAVFDIPDGYGIGCAIAKIAKNDGKVKGDSDFENTYAQTEPLTDERAEIFDRFNTVNRVISDLGLHNAYDMPGFWIKDRTDYKVIPTNYNKGYMQALKDVEKEIRLRFGFAERQDIDRPLTIDL